jgi:hypothetical protein
MPTIVKIGEYFKRQNGGYAQAERQYRDLVRADFCVTKKKKLSQKLIATKFEPAL